MGRATYSHLRFERQIRSEGRCVLWTGSMNKDGIGRFTIGSRTDGTRRQESAQRYSYRFYNGPVAVAQVVYSTCGTKGCVKPEHLKSGARADVIRQTIKRGKWSKGDSSRFPKDQRGEKNPNHKLTDQQAMEILIQKGRTKALIISRTYQVSEGTVYSIWRGRRGIAG